MVRSHREPAEIVEAQLIHLLHQPKDALDAAFYLPADRAKLILPVLRRTLYDADPAVRQAAHKSLRFFGKLPEPEMSAAGVRAVVQGEQ